MSTVTCPHCRRRLDVASTPVERCPHCGRNIAWLTRQTDFVIRGRDIWRIARGQRFSNICMVGLLAAYATTAWLWSRPEALVLLGFVLFALHVMLCAAVLEFSAGLAVHRGGSAFAALLALTPGTNILVVMLLNWRAWRVFRRIAIRWRLFGYSETALLRRFAHPFCRACGYDLTGNLSGRCPECGTPTDE